MNSLMGPATCGRPEDLLEGYAFVTWDTQIRIDKCCLLRITACDKGGMLWEIVGDIGVSPSQRGLQCLTARVGV